MPIRDLHDQAFDEPTLAKLSLFKKNLQEWFPVALHNKYWKTINIFDFFAGPGKDEIDNPGSPLLILNEVVEIIKNNKVKKNADKIRQKSIHLFFNELDLEKFDLLKKNLAVEDQSSLVQCHYSNLPFQEAFQQFYPRMNLSKTGNFLFLDQNGIKEINRDVFHKITSLKSTDFLFFISSSYIWRFKDQPEFKEISKWIGEYSTNIHREVCNYYKNLLPNPKEYLLAPFSLKKGSNIYGLIFGSGHYYGLEKFLVASWKTDPVNGEANYPLEEEDEHEGNLNFFDGEIGITKPTKVENFEKELKKQILSKTLATNQDIYRYSLTQGFLPKHINKIFKELVKENKLPKQKPDFTHNCVKESETVSIQYFT